MQLKTIVFSLISFTLAGAPAACGGEEKPPATPAPEASATPAKPETPAKAAPTERPALVLSYEALRDALANDDLAKTKAAAGSLAKASADHAEIAAAAKKVAAAADLDAARLSFGEASKAYIGVLVATPDLAKGLHVFRCPMAIGYKKWVQTKREMENPYMGQRMLQCGAKVDLAI